MGEILREAEGNKTPRSKPHHLQRPNYMEKQCNHGHDIGVPFMGGMLPRFIGSESSCWVRRMCRMHIVSDAITHMPQGKGGGRTSTITPNSCISPTMFSFFPSPRLSFIFFPTQGSRVSNKGPVRKGLQRRLLLSASLTPPENLRAGSCFDSTPTDASYGKHP